MNRLLLLVLIITLQNGAKALEHLELWVSAIEENIAKATSYPYKQKPGTGFTQNIDNNIIALKHNIDDLMYLGKITVIENGREKVELLGYRTSDDQDIFRLAKLWFKANFLVHSWNQKIAGSDFKKLAELYGDINLGINEEEYEEHTILANQIALFAREVVINPEVILNPYRDNPDQMIPAVVNAFKRHGGEEYKNFEISHAVEFLELFGVDTSNKESILEFFNYIWELYNIESNSLIRIWTMDRDEYPLNQKLQYDRPKMPNGKHYISDSKFRQSAKIRRILLQDSVNGFDDDLVGKPYVEHLASLDQISKQGKASEIITDAELKEQNRLRKAAEKFAIKKVGIELKHSSLDDPEIFNNKGQQVVRFLSADGQTKTTAVVNPSSPDGKCGDHSMTCSGTRELDQRPHDEQLDQFDIFRRHKYIMHSFLSDKEKARRFRAVLHYWQISSISKEPFEVDEFNDTVLKAAIKKLNEELRTTIYPTEEEFLAYYIVKEFLFEQFHRAKLNLIIETTKLKEQGKATELFQARGENISIKDSYNPKTLLGMENLINYLKNKYADIFAKLQIRHASELVNFMRKLKFSDSWADSHENKKASFKAVSEHLRSHTIDQVGNNLINNAAFQQAANLKNKDVFTDFDGLLKALKPSGSKNHLESYFKYIEELGKIQDFIHDDERNNKLNATFYLIKNILPSTIHMEYLRSKSLDELYKYYNDNSDAEILTRIDGYSNWLEDSQMILSMLFTGHSGSFVINTRQQSEYEPRMTAGGTSEPVARQPNPQNDPDLEQLNKSPYIHLALNYKYQFMKEYGFNFIDNLYLVLHDGAHFTGISLINAGSLDQLAMGQYNFHFAPKQRQYLSQSEYTEAAKEGIIATVPISREKIEEIKKQFPDDWRKKINQKKNKLGFEELKRRLNDPSLRIIDTNE